MNQLEQILSQYNRPAKALELVEAPQCYRVRLQPLRRTLASGKPGQLTRISHLRSLADDIAAALRVQEYGVIVHSDRGVWLEIAKDRPDLVLARNLTPPIGTLPIVLGLNTHNRVLSIDLANPSTAHVLISGATGSGKSVLLDSVILSICKKPGEAMMIGIDPHGTFAKWNKALAVYETTSDPYRALTLLNSAVALVQNRLSNSLGIPSRWVIVIDEFDHLLQTSVGKEVNAALAWLSKNARKVGVHVVMATQYPGHEVCKSHMKTNLAAKIAMKVGSWQDSQVAMGYKGAERLNGKGDGYLVVGGNRTRFQGAVVEDVDMMGVAQKPVAQKKVPAPAKVGKKGSRWDKVKKALGI